MNKHQHKYRYWDKTKMIYDFILHSSGVWQDKYSICHETFCGCQEYGIQRESSLNKEHIMQYIELNDMCNVEIYVGDILQEDSPRGNKWRVFEVEGGFAINSFQDEIKQVYSGHESTGDQQTSGYIKTQFKVIGNIYETPELLEIRQ